MPYYVITVSFCDISVAFRVNNILPCHYSVQLWLYLCFILKVLYFSKQCLLRQHYVLLDYCYISVSYCIITRPTVSSQSPVVTLVLFCDTSALLCQHSAYHAYYCDITMLYFVDNMSYPIITFILIFQCLFVT